jgi:hypothetical protein
MDTYYLNSNPHPNLVACDVAGLVSEYFIVKEPKYKLYSS